MSYSYYRNDISKVTTPIHSGYKRFWSMCAQYRYTVNEHYEQWDFVSYATPILRVEHNFNGMWYVDFNWESFDCSRTTIRQVNKFFKFIGCPCSIATLRKHMESGAHVVCWANGLTTVSMTCSVLRGRFDIDF